MAVVVAANRPRELPLPLRNAALAAGAVVGLTGRGDLWVLALTFGVADASALTALVVALASAATLARTGSAGLSDIAGGQAVLGTAGFHGSTVAIAAAWTSAVALVLAGRDRWTGMVLGALAAAIVVGPSFNGGWRLAVGHGAALVAGGTLGRVVAPNERRLRWQPWMAVAVGIGALFLGFVAGYR